MALRDPELSSLVTRLRADRKDGRDVLDITAEWSAALRHRLDDNLAATGSVARGEATPASDVDVLRLAPGPTPQLDALLTSGVSSDDNGVLASSHDLPGTREEWRRSVAGWLAEPWRDTAVVKTGLLADCADTVRDQASTGFATSPMLSMMLRDAVSTRTPRLRGLGRRNTVDVKTDLLTPLVKIARWAALASGSNELSTPRRLAASDPRFLDADTAVALTTAFREAMALRFDLDTQVGETRVYDRRDRIMVTALPAAAAAALRTSATTVRQTAKKLTYLLSTSTFTVDAAPGAHR